ncbi:FMN-binding negative transcriptional regulator [Mesorhizobium sp. M1399]|uniref:FMN-binding negative transcriptional regulator n=1 Tax=Mesorhizobium sp. M1399 TaxID=2957096 RepID=UPI00333A9B4A
MSLRDKFVRVFDWRVGGGSAALTFGFHGALPRLNCSRINPVWQELADGDEVLVVFRAAEAYISPNWYPSVSGQLMPFSAGSAKA